MRVFRSNFTIDDINQEFSSAQELAHAQDARIPPLPAGSENYSLYFERRDALRELEFQGVRRDKYASDAERQSKRRAKAASKVPTAPVQASEEERAKRHQRLHERGGRCFICAGLELVDG